MKTFDKGLDINKVKEISNIKNEPNWMKEFRLSSYNIFKNMKMPSFGPDINLNLDNIVYYKKAFDSVDNNWDNIEENVKQTFEDNNTEQYKNIEAKPVTGKLEMHTIDVGQRRFLVILMTHDVWKASVSHQYTDAHKDLSHIQLEFSELFF
jgi:Fe-S cluster assembly scaffold protein SufB